MAAPFVVTATATHNLGNSTNEHLFEIHAAAQPNCKRHGEVAEPSSSPAPAALAYASPSPGETASAMTSSSPSDTASGACR
jgi:hypothetical protein